MARRAAHAIDLLERGERQLLLFPIDLAARPLRIRGRRLRFTHHSHHFP
jgi:hypothetical protein